MIPWWWTLVAFVIGQLSAVIGIALASAAQTSEETIPERGIGTIQTSTRTHWPDDNADIIDLDDRRGVTEQPERGRGA